MPTADPSPLTPASPTRPVRVWDLPTRLFHWALVVCIVVLVITGNVGGNAMHWHFVFGLTVGALLLFRLVWGVIGGRWSRFASFFHSPAALLRYLRGGRLAGQHADVGHTPVGSLSVFAMLAVLLLQVGTGLFADDEIDAIGPLNQFVSNHVATLASGWHKGYGKTLLLVLIGLHLAAIAYYLMRKRLNLVKPMISGDKLLPAATPASHDTWGSRVLAAVLLAVFGALAAWVYRLGG